MSPSSQRSEVTLAPPATAADLALAAESGLALAPARDATAWQLVRSDDGLTLRSPAAAGDLTIRLDLQQGPLARRLRTARSDEPLARAIGLPKRQGPRTVVDATAGLGRDAMVLAQLGCTVIALERIPALAMLVAAAVRQSPLRERLRVCCAEAETWLRTHAAAAPPDVVYLDPMFATAGSAQVKKEMQACRALAGPPDDAAALLRTARAVARQRVVVKRHPHLPPLADDVSFRVAGSRVRFDVYLRPAAPAAAQSP
jgi:16S rRNA (guanine1516-N2)-methyltransferase